MNEQMQRCNKCKAINDPLNTSSLGDGWVRVVGPSKTMRPSNVTVDLCASCAESTKVSELPAFATPPKPPVAVALGQPSTPIKVPTPATPAPAKKTA